MKDQAALRCGEIEPRLGRDRAPRAAQGQGPTGLAVGAATPSPHQRARAVIALTLALWLPAGRAFEEGVGPRGAAFAMGGVGEEDLQALLARRGDFSLALLTAASGSGAFLAGVQVRITLADGSAPVLEQTLSGPWLLMALPPGRYRIEAAVRPAAGAALQTRSAITTIARGARREVVLYFDTGDDRLALDRADGSTALPEGAAKGGPSR